MKLHPDHLADLRKSGLTDETIAAMQCETVAGGYKIPYFNLDGSQNCFNRLKLIPPHKTSDGHTQRYHQEKGSDSHLYLLPIISWPAFTSDPMMPLVITEGEKKSCAGCQVGLTIIGVAGVWSWRMKLDSGERLVLPTLDQFIWKGRAVEIVPDSDLWKPEKVEGLKGFYALGMELVSRGAVVTFVRLPNACGEKVGLDDWLVAVGDGWSAQWDRLERIVPDHASMKEVAFWWQGWRGKHAEQAAIQQRPAVTFDVQETGGVYTVAFPAYQVRFIFDHLTAARNGIYAELLVQYGSGTPTTELMSGTDISLKADQSKKNIAITLSRLIEDIPWKILLPQACAEIVKRHRVGDPPQHLTYGAEADNLTFLVNPLVYANHATVLYGDGGLLKSYLALLVGMCVDTGSSVAGLRAIKGRVLYLDYEAEFADHVHRHRRLSHGHPELKAADIVYRRCAVPLAQMLAQVSRLVVEHGIALMIVDSLALACGGNPKDPDVAIRYFGALRQFPCASFTIGHVPKPTDAEASIFGSVFFKNLARSTWEANKVGEPGDRSIHLSLSNAKYNLDGGQPTFGLEVSFEQPDATTFSAFNVADEPELAAALPLKTRIKHALKERSKTANQLADELNLSARTIRSRLGEGEKEGWAFPIGKQDGEILWGIAHG